MAAHSRRVQSKGAASMGSSGITETSRGTHGRIGSGLRSNSSWNSNSIWGDDSYLARTAMEGRSGSSSLLSSSESDGWNARPNVPWSTVSTSSAALSSIAQTSGMSTPPVQSRSTDRNAPALSDGSGNDTNYFGLHMSSGVAPSPGTGQMASYLDSGSERISPSGEGNALGSHNLLRNGERKHVSFAGNPAAAGFHTQSGYASPLDNPRPDEMNMSSLPQTLPDAIQQRINRKGYAHSSHNSASFAPQRPVHTSYPSFHSESQFEGRYDSGSVDLSADIDRLQLSEGDLQTHQAASRPPYVSHASLDTSLNRLGYRNPSEEASYHAMQGHGNEVITSNHQLGYQPGRSSRLGEPDIASPAEFTPLDSPYYPARGNGPNTSRRYRNGFANNASDSQAAMLQGRLRELQSLEATYPVANTLARQSLPPPYDYGYHSPSLLASLYQPVAQLNAAALASRRQRDHVSSQDAYGPVLADFRMHGKNKRFELKDIYGHVVEFSGDQYGSRFLQQKLETANSDEKEQVFREIQPNCLQLAADIFGNYVVQKLFEHGNQSQKKLLANQMKGHIYALSTAPYGCRVVQKALEHVLTDQQASLVKELEPRVGDCVSNNNGNHVIQKAIERVPSQYTKFVVEAFKNNVEKQAKHAYGCRVLQRMLEHCEEDDRRSMLAELHACTGALIEDQFGNYVIQHVIQHGEEEDRSAMIEVVMYKLLAHSKHKFASNVVEKSIEYGNEAQRREMIERLTFPTEDGDSRLLDLMSDQYGNYVIQKILGQLKGAERVELVERIKPLLGQLKRYNCCKQIAAIEKLIGDSSPIPNAAVPTPNRSSTTPPNSHGSSPQPSRRGMEDHGAVFGAAPPTPPPTDNQSNGDVCEPHNADLNGCGSAEVSTAS